MRLISLSLLWLPLSLTACSGGSEDKASDTDPELDDPTGTDDEEDDVSDTEDDADDPTDTEDEDDPTDTEDDADDPTDTEESDTETSTSDTEDERVDCDEDLSISVASGSECLVGSIDDEFDCAAGETWTIVTSNEGGSSWYNSDHYNDSYCFIPYDDYDGEEFVVEFNVPEDTWADVTLYSPCTDLSLTAARTTDECFDSATVLGECEGDVGSDVTIDKLWGYNNGYRYELIVDSPDGSVGNFELTVTCY